VSVNYIITLLYQRIARGDRDCLTRKTVTLAIRETKRSDVSIFAALPLPKSSKRPARNLTGVNDLRLGAGIELFVTQQVIIRHATVSLLTRMS
jgi:hypothetical protein